MPWTIVYKNPSGFRSTSALKMSIMVREMLGVDFSISEAFANEFKARLAQLHVARSKIQPADIYRAVVADYGERHQAVEIWQHTLRGDRDKLLMRICKTPS